MISDLASRLQREKEAVLQSKDLQYSFLRNIITHKDVEALDLYVALGFDLNVRNDILETALFEWSLYKDINFFELFIDRGINIFALNYRGEHVLFDLVNRHEDDIELFVKILLERGLNPYVKSQHNKDVFDGLFDTSYISAEFIREHSIFDKADVTYFECLQEGLYPLALSTSEADVQLAGGINEVIPFLNNRFVKKIIFNYQNALMLNKKYEEATLLTECFVKEENELTRMSFSKRAFSLLPAFITNNESVFFNTAIAVTNHANSSFYPKSVFMYRIFEKSFTNLYPASKEIKYYMDLEWNRVLSSMSERGIINPFFTINFEGDKELAINQLKSIEQETERHSDFLRHIEHLFFLGMSWFYFRDYFNAEYYLTKVVQACKDKMTDERFEFEFVHSMAMLDCIQREREE